MGFVEHVSDADVGGAPEPADEHEHDEAAAECPAAQTVLLSQKLLTIAMTVATVWA
jgi:hypothetical protein